MSRLALLGGSPVIDRPLGRPWPEYGEPEEQALLEVLHSRVWWRGGHAEPRDSWVVRFEDAFSRYQDCEYGVAVPNGTQALEVGLKAVGVQPGEEVIVPCSTFIASATAVLLVNAIPIIVDIEPDYYQLDPAAVEAAIGPNTAGILPVHYGGYPADMDRLNAIAAQHGLFVVEDCAHAHGSQWRGQGCGGLGDVGCFSLQMGKTLTCGEGGIVTTKHQTLAEKAFSYHHIGRLPGRPFYEFHLVASNHRMTEWQGAIAYEQTLRLPEQIERREANAKYFEAGLREIPGVEPMHRRPEVTRWGFYFYHFKFRSEQFEGLSLAKFHEAVGAEGVPVGSGHLHPIQQNPVFANRTFGQACWPAGREAPDYTRVETPVAERILAEEGCSLPHATFLGDTSDMDLVLDAIRKVRENVKDLR